MKNKRNLNTKWLLLQNDQNADTTLLHSHDELGLERCASPFQVEEIFNLIFPIKVNLVFVFEDKYV